MQIVRELRMEKQIIIGNQTILKVGEKDHLRFYFYS